MSGKYMRFKYSEDALATAINDINNGQLSLNKASVKYGIPKSTLHNKLKNKVPNVRKMGPLPFLTHIEEDKIANWILSKAKLGFPMHPEEIKDSVQKVLKDAPRPNKFTDDRPGDKWLKLFLQRYPNISKRNTEIISKSRASVTEDSIRKWFLELKEYLVSENLLDMMSDSSRIFNADETGMRTCVKSGLVLGPAKNFKNLYEVASGNEKESITVLCNYGANGIAAPAMTVFPYKRIPKELALSVPAGWAIGRSDSGWMTSATFFEYIANIFYPWLLENMITLPVILFIDGHKSHYNLELYEFCVEKQILLYCLHPNSTHILQPCDVSIFRPLKVEWKAVCRAHKQKTHTSITRHNFSLLFKEAFDRACKPKTIINGFRISGLYPLNPDAVDYSKCISTRRKEIFQSSNDVTSELTVEDFKSCLKVIEHYLSNKEFTTVMQLDINDKILLFYNYVKQNINEVPRNIDETNDPKTLQQPYANNLIDKVPSNIHETNDLKTLQQPYSNNSILFTESLLNSLPVEIDGILYESNFENLILENNNETCNMINWMDVELCCLELVEKIIENVFEIVEKKMNLVQCSVPQEKTKINIISNITIGKGELNKVWNKHLHWPKIEGEQKKRNSRIQMPYAITSKKWVEYHSEQEEKKVEKNKKKLEKELKKNAIDKTNKETKKSQNSKKKNLSKNKNEITQEIVENKCNKNSVTKIKNYNPQSTITQIQTKSKEDDVPIVFQNDIAEKKDFEIGTFVIVKYKNKKYPGVIRNIDSNEFEISVMKSTKKNVWIWPKVADQIWYSERQILKTIPEPVLVKNECIINLNN